MSGEPAAKKPRLELSDASEPLTQKDVIYFQKEALFRCLHSRRNEVETLNGRLALVQRDYQDVTMKISNIIALIVTLAKFLENYLQDAEDKKVVNTISEGDEDSIVQLSDSFMRILVEFVHQNRDNTNDSNSVDDSLVKLTNEFKFLQNEKKKLAIDNKNLLQELNSLKNYYENLIHKYDRNESVSIKRVFKKEDENSNAEENDNTDEANIKEDKMENVSQDEQKSKVNEKVEENVNSKTENDSNSDKNKEENDEIVQEYKDKIITLENNIDSLKIMINDLQTAQKSDKEKIQKLEIDLLSTNDHNKEFITEKDLLLNKINVITTKNQELNELNSSYLDKFQKLNNEKEIYSKKINEEFNTNLDNLKKINLSLEKDLVRIRTTRDDLLSKIAILENQKDKSIIIEDLKKSLEISNNQWLKFEARSKINTNNDKNDTSNEAKSQDVLIKEIQDMEEAFKSMTELNNKKYNELINQDSIISKLSIEKSKADQKYFAAMRSKDSILIENKNLSKTVAKGNEYITQLKDAEKLYLQKINNLQDQIKLSQMNEKRLIDSNKLESMKFIELNSTINKLKKMVTHYKDENINFVHEINKLKAINNELETNNKALNLKLTQENKSTEKLMNRIKQLHKGGVNGHNGSNDHHYANEDNETLVTELENFRTLVYCSLCSKNWKNTAIKTCGHVFCEDCCKERLAARMRKCPTCNNPFASPDLVTIHL